MRILWRCVFLLLVTFVSVAGALAQDATGDETTVDLPVSHLMQGFSYEPQMWNNCGPATLTNALTYFGYTDNQRRAAGYLKPNDQDKNVNPWEMVDFVNTQVPEIPVYAVYRVGGNIDLLRTLLYSDFPVIIEEGYDPPPHDLGWMGHYLLLIGYDDSTEVFTTLDSYEGANVNYSYAQIDQFWQHFNRTYIVLYGQSREAELMALLGDDVDPGTNASNALQQARDEATADNNDSFAWFNMGTNFVMIARFYPEGSEERLLYYDYAATAFNQARTVGEGLPWRMMWYQFGPYEAYNGIGRYGDTTSLARTVIDNYVLGANETHFPVEETYYYAGIAREALGETDRAITNYSTAVSLNSNFILAREALDSLPGD